MDLHQAMMLVREKYLGETKGISTGQTTDRYKEACAKFPAVMAVAHQL